MWSRKTTVRSFPLNFRKSGKMAAKAADEDIAGIKLNRNYNLDAPKGVNGRNSDNSLIQKYFGWEPSIKLREGMAKTYAWIHDEYMAKYGATASSA